MWKQPLGLLGAAALALALAGPAPAQEPVKVGLLLSLTGPFASTGRQIEAAAQLYVAQHGDEVAGRRIELIVRDDTGVADVTRRLAQELVVREEVDVLAGFVLTPLAMATAPVATEARVPMVVTSAATSIITEQSPYIARTSFTLPQATVGIAEWSAENGIERVVTLVTDYAPGIDAETQFVETFTARGGEVVEQLRVPLQNPTSRPSCSAHAMQSPTRCSCLSRPGSVPC